MEGWRINDCFFVTPFCGGVRPVKTLRDVKHVAILDNFDRTNIHRLQEFPELAILCLPESMSENEREFRAVIPESATLRIY